VRSKFTEEGNRATAYVAYHTSFHLSGTPASPMRELANEWAYHGKLNLRDGADIKTQS
jgi:hypothetical protein